MSIEFVPPVAAVAQTAGVPVAASGIIAQVQQPATQAAPVGLVSADDADAILAAAQPAGAAQAAEPTSAPAETSGAAVEPAKAPQTPREKLESQIAKLSAKIAKDQEQLANLTTKLESIDTFAALAVGAAVEIKIGRAETTRNVIGRVVAEDGGRYKVFHGEGMDADITVVQSSQILRVIPE